MELSKPCIAGVAEQASDLSRFVVVVNAKMIPSLGIFAFADCTLPVLGLEHPLIVLVGNAVSLHHIAVTAISRLFVSLFVPRARFFVHALLALMAQIPLFVGVEVISMLNDLAGRAGPTGYSIRKQIFSNHQ